MGDGDGSTGPQAGRAPEAGPSWNERAALDPLAAVLDHAGSVAKNRLLDRVQQQALRQHVGDVSGLRVLDFGCGTGRIAAMLAKRDARVVGLDASESMLTRARALTEGVDFIAAADASVLVAGSIDLVVTVGVLQYFPRAELDAVTRSLATCLRPGGRLVGLEQVHDGGLERGARRDDYQAVMRRCGLVDVQTTLVRRADSRLQRGLERLACTPLLGAAAWLLRQEAGRDRRALVGGAYADCLLVATKG